VRHGPSSLALPPLPSSLEADTVVEVERVVARAATVALGGHVVLAAEILAGRQVGIRIEGATLRELVKFSVCGWLVSVS
jgi:hypothetical protein